MERLLHEVPKVNASSLTDEDVHTIIVHTSFYISFLLANFVLSLYVVKCFVRYRPTNNRLFWLALMAIGWTGLWCHMSGTLISVIRGNAWYEPESLKSATQRWILRATRDIRAHSWGWIFIIVWRFVVPSDFGVRVTLQLRRTGQHPAGDEERDGAVEETHDCFGFCSHSEDKPCEDRGEREDHGRVLPRRVMTMSFQVMVLIAALGALFHEQWETDDSVSLPVAAALKSKPYAFIATPLWFLMTLNLGMGIYLTNVQQRLSKGHYDMFLIAIGALLFLSVGLCVCIVLDEERFTWIFAVIAGASMFLWIVVLTRDDIRNGGWKGWRAVAYLALMVAVGLGSYLHFVLCFFYGMTLCCYSVAVPHREQIYVTLEPITSETQRSAAKDGDATASSHLSRIVGKVTTTILG